VSAPRIAIVGAGAIAAAFADVFTRHGHAVTIFEKGPDLPYPHQPQFETSIVHGHLDERFRASHDLRKLTQSGDYLRDLTAERVMGVGGSASQWAGLTMRMRPHDFTLRTTFGFEADWPIGYAEIEPWYCEAESFLGVSGTDEDNPFAPPRSKPYPLPPFPLTADDVRLAALLAGAGIHMHTTPQARTHLGYDGRPACMNIGVCEVCPIGVRYSPNHHLQRAVGTGLCTIVPDTSVRRVVLDAQGRARALVIRGNADTADREFPADLVIIGAGAFESARLLLLSRDAKRPEGIGNAGGHVGANLVFHHVWSGHMHWKEPVYAGKVGWWTGQSQQFCEPKERGRVGGVKIELPSNIWSSHVVDAGLAPDATEVVERLEILRHCRRVAIHSESVTDPGKRLTLSETFRDPFGDPAAHVQYAFPEFDRRSYDHGREIFEQVAKSTGAYEWFYRPIEDFATFAHQMGTTRMGTSEKDSVTDGMGRVHGTQGLWTLGLGSFVGAGGAVNPTLTAVALALRAATALLEELGPA
jgi:glucose dehydrogenase